jgi:uncharacterized SAM-binding protein YcdF (DUF218 family)
LTRETCNRRKPGEKAGTGADKPLDKSAVPQSNVHDMSLLLDKIIPLFVYPVGFAVAAGLLCLVFLAWGWRRAAATCIAVSTAYLWLAATPAVAALLARSLEAPYPQVAAESVEPADTIVVLGGMMNPPKGASVYPDLEMSADRLVYAARLYRAGRSGRIIVTGGRLFAGAAVPSEAELVKQQLLLLGVPDDAIILETKARNTRENGLFSRELLQEMGAGKVLLVTSAWHMRRSEAVFGKLGIDVIPAATDSFLPQLSSGFPFGWLPDVDAMAVSTRCIKEWIGLGVYRLRGWI